jgi:galactokinase
MNQKQNQLYFLRDYHDIIKLQEKLLVCGELSESSVQEKAGMFRSCAAKLIAQDIDPQSEAHGFYVPGRIEILGKHTDYAGGRSVVATAEKGFCFVAAPRDDNVIRIFDIAAKETISFSLDPELVPQLGHWSNYPQTVARRVSRNFAGPLRGADIAFCSDLPQASGMSSSSAMMVGFFLVLSKINQLDQQDAYRENIQSQEDLAGYLGTVENGQSFQTLTGDKGVGTFGGSEDHTAILCSQSNQLRQYSYCPVRFEKTITVPEEYVFAIASSGVVAEKTGAALEKYNRASRLASKVVEVWQKETGKNDPHIAAMLKSLPDEDVEKIRGVLRKYDGQEFSANDILNRFEQFYAEQVEIIPPAGEALETQNMHKFGEVVDRSQRLAEELLGNQVAETIYLVRSARELGAAAASAFGAGFGGSVWALVREVDVDDFLKQWAQNYKEKFSSCAERARFFVTRAGTAAFAI